MFDLHFFHGFLGSPEDWTPLTQSFSKEYRCIFHRLGLPEKIYAPSILIGYSMGGRAALEEYYKEPEKVAGIILISSNPGLSSELEKEKRGKEEQEWVERAERFGIPAFIEWWYDQPLFAPFKKSALFETYLEKRKHISLEEMLCQIKAHSMSKTENFWEKLSEITAPLYFLFGEHDTKYSPVHKKCGGLNKALIPGCGHAAHLEDPLACARYIERFIQKVQHDCVENGKDLFGHSLL